MSLRSLEVRVIRGGAGVVGCVTQWTLRCFMFPIKCDFFSLSKALTLALWLCPYVFILDTSMIAPTGGFCVGCRHPTTQQRNIKQNRLNCRFFFGFSDFRAGRLGLYVFLRILGPDGLDCTFFSGFLGRTAWIACFSPDSRAGPTGRVCIVGFSRLLRHKLY